jgi:uncharacterized protein YrrD
MEEVRDVLPIGTVIGMTILSRSTGNRLGTVGDLCIDPVNGLLLGLTIALGENGTALLTYDDIYSFGRDAIMAETDESVRPLGDDSPVHLPQAREHLIGTKIITENGKLLGQIRNVFVTLQPPPFVIYEIRESIFDKLLGREIFILASTGHALSSDGERLVVPEGTAETAAANISDLINQALSVRTFDPAGHKVSFRNDDTWVPAGQEDETVVRRYDEDETVLRPPRPAKTEQ